MSMTYTAQPYVLTNQNSSAFWLIDNLWMPLATGVQTGGQFCLLEQVCASGIGGPPTHAHKQDEGFYVIEGQCTFQAGGKTVVAGAGTFISVPRDTPHSFKVDQPGTHVLNFYLPSGFEHILMSIAVPAPERKAPPPNATPMPPAWIVEELSREYGQSKVLGMPFVDIPDENNTTTTPSPTNPIQPYGVMAKDAPSFWGEDILWSVLATTEQTGGSYSLLEELCPKGSGAPPHWHEQDEMFYFLEGSADFVADDQRFSAGGGAFVFIPRGTVHAFRVTSELARFLNFYTPGGFERAIMETSAPATSFALPPKGLPLQADMPKVLALFAQIGMHPVALSDAFAS